MMSRVRYSLLLSLAAPLALAACSSDEPDFVAGPIVTITTVGVDGASCELEDAQGRRYFVQSTPGRVTLSEQPGEVRVTCRRIGFGVGETRFGPDASVRAEADTDILDDIVWLLGFGPEERESVAAGPYPSTVIVDLNGAAPVDPTPFRAAEGDRLLGPADGSSAGQQVWSSEMRDRPAPPPQAFASAPPPPPPPPPGVPPRTFGAVPVQAPPPVRPGGAVQRPDGSLRAATTFPGPGTRAAPLIPLPAPEPGARTASGAPRVARRPASLGDYAVQVGAFAEMANAELMMRALEARGYDPELSTVQDAQGRDWARVRFGVYPDRRAASRAAEDFRRAESMAAVVVPR